MSSSLANKAEEVMLELYEHAAATVNSVSIFTTGNGRQTQGHHNTSVEPTLHWVNTTNYHTTQGQAMAC